MSNYLLKPKLNTVKQAFFLEDKDGNVVYEGKMTKFKLFGASPFEFVNHVTEKTEEHTVGKTITIEENHGIDIVSLVVKRVLNERETQRHVQTFTVFDEDVVIITGGHYDFFYSCFGEELQLA